MIQYSTTPETIWFKIYEIIINQFENNNTHLLINQHHLPSFLQAAKTKQNDDLHNEWIKQTKHK
jgi:hypothetical protein